MNLLSSKSAKVLLGSLILFSPTVFAADLPDVCATEGVSTTITNGAPICVTNNGTAWLSIGGGDSHNSIAITTGHGTGDLNLFVRNGGWPNTASNSTDPKSLTAGTNTECVIISNPSQYWTNVGITGTRSGTSLVVDFGATSCRSVGGGTTDPGGNTGAITAPNNFAGTSTSSAITLTWSDNSNNEDNFIIQRSVDGSAWADHATVDANTTTYTDSGLTSNKSYSYVMFAKNTTNSSGWSSTISVTTKDGGTTEPTPTGYCSATGAGTYEWIAGVKLGNVNNTSNQSNYADYTAQTASIGSGSNSITLTPGFNSGQYDEYFSVWIDFNKDGDFVDSGEQVVNGVKTRAATTQTFNVPSSASGKTRMRVAMKYNSATTGPCANIASGEIEDYSVSFGGPTDPTDPTDPVEPGVLPDVCATQEPSEATSLVDGVPICVPGTNAFKGYSVSTYNVSPTVTSIAFSSAHGLGNLDLAARGDGSWPKPGDDSLRSRHVGNTECVILTNPNSNGWNNVNLEGLFKGVSVVADFNATKCRVTPGAADPGNTGYKYNKVHVIVYPFRFLDKDLSFTTAKINEELTKTKNYFREQSYGKFDFTWEIKPKTTIQVNKSTVDNDKNKWKDYYRPAIKATGVDPDFPAAGTIIMVTSEKIGPNDGEAATAINSQASPPLMEIYTHAGSTIAHETGHALGLHHSKSLESNGSTITGNESSDTVVDYGNVFSMMGMGGHTFEEFNLMYKGYFTNPPWFSTTEVPTITTSGTYRLYTYDQGTSSGHGAPGIIGFKLKSGGAGDKTYWVEYHTSQHGEDGSPQPLRTPLLQDGILVNLQGYQDNNAQPWWNHTSLLLDFTPNSRSSSWALEDFNDAPLLIGNTFSDPWGGFTITPTGKGGTLGTSNAWIDVEVIIQ